MTDRTSPPRSTGNKQGGGARRRGGTGRSGAQPPGGRGRGPRRGGGSKQPSGRARPTTPATADSPDWLYGVHAVRAALHNPARRLLRLLATENAHDSIAEPAHSRGLHIETVPARDIDRLFPPGTVHQGLALRVTPLAEPVLADIVQRAAEDGLEKPLIVLDQVTDPHNVGAVLRSAAVFGARAVIVTRRHAPPITGALAKAASGAVEQMPLVQVPNVAQAIAVLQAEGWFAVGLDGAASRALGATDLTGKIALVMGAEGSGLRRLTAERCDALAKIAGDIGFASLNVSNAAAVALYEISRQRS